MSKTTTLAVIYFLDIMPVSFSGATLAPKIRVPARKTRRFVMAAKAEAGISSLRSISAANRTETKASGSFWCLLGSYLTPCSQGDGMKAPQINTTSAKVTRKVACCARPRLRLVQILQPRTPGRSLVSC